VEKGPPHTPSFQLLSIKTTSHGFVHLFNWYFTLRVLIGFVIGGVLAKNFGLEDRLLFPLGLPGFFAIVLYFVVKNHSRAT